MLTCHGCKSCTNCNAQHACICTELAYMHSIPYAVYLYVRLFAPSVYLLLILSYEMCSGHTCLREYKCTGMYSSEYTRNMAGDGLAVYLYV